MSAKPSASASSSTGKTQADFDREEAEFEEYKAEADKKWNPSSLTGQQYWEKGLAKVKLNPAVPIGVGATCFAMWRAIRAHTDRDSGRLIFWFRARIAAQGFTILALIYSAAVIEGRSMKLFEDPIGLMKERFSSYKKLSDYEKAKKAEEQNPQTFWGYREFPKEKEFNYADSVPGGYVVPPVLEPQNKQAKPAMSVEQKADLVKNLKGQMDEKMASRPVGSGILEGRGALREKAKEE